MRPLEVEDKSHTPPLPPLPSWPATAPRRRTSHATTARPTMFKELLIGILSLFLSYLWMTSTSAAETRFILNIAKSFCITIF
jgi:hypothetical protein